MTVDSVWYFFSADEPVRCPAPNGRTGRCNRAQDIVAPGTAVRVRLLSDPSQATLPSSLLRECRACGATLEVNVAPTVGVSR